MLLWWGESNVTHRWQPIDAGLTSLWKKTFARKVDDIVCADEDEMGRWLRGAPSAQERRLLCLAAAYETDQMFWSPQYDWARQSAWISTGCALTATGENDEAVKPQGMPTYRPPAPGTAVPEHLLESRRKELTLEVEPVSDEGEANSEDSDSTDSSTDSSDESSSSSVSI